MATGQPANREQQPTQWPVCLQRLQRVCGTGGVKPTRPRQQRRERPSVEMDGQSEQESEQLQRDPFSNDESRVSTARRSASKLASRALGLATTTRCIPPGHRSRRFRRRTPLGSASDNPTSLLRRGDDQPLAPLGPPAAEDVLPGAGAVALAESVGAVPLQLGRLVGALRHEKTPETFDVRRPPRLAQAGRLSQSPVRAGLSRATRSAARFSSPSAERDRMNRPPAPSPVRVVSSSQRSPLCRHLPSSRQFLQTPTNS